MGGLYATPTWAAYGIVEEGVMTRSFFCPTWPDLGILAEYGRWIGVNWVWAIQLTIFHAVFSIIYTNNIS
ncbi:MAG: hypothetical protein J7J65_02910 [Candidatus Korarchaeota archaeon]|nr:hypothetical protein [Candidatus Korarchaeota archaeon]